MNKYFSITFIVVVFLIIYGCEGRYSSLATEAIGRSIIEEVPTIDYKAKKAGVDTEASIINWKGTKLMGARFHAGTIKLKDGYLAFNNDSLTGGGFIADMNAIDVTDIPSHETEAIRNLIQHLKKDFDVRWFPVSKFEITKVEYRTRDSMQVWGNLTIKDVTKNIAIPVKLLKSGEDTIWVSTFQFNRFEWHIGMDGSWLEKRLVDKKVELKIKVLMKNSP